MSIGDKDRNLLFAILALQNGFVSQDQMLAAFREYTRDSTDAMPKILKRHGVNEPAIQAITLLVDAHREDHECDEDASIAALGRLETKILESIQEIDPDIESSEASRVVDQPTYDITLSASLGKSTNNGRFQILRPYAKGGLGEVFVARDEELDREVALKQIRGRDNAIDRRERFVREAEITGKLEHPGIVPIYGLGVDEKGSPYYAMRFIRGQSFKEAIRKFHKANKNSGRCLSTRNREFHRLLGWFVDVCHAISYAHSRGVLHRDIKPSNVMIGRFGETLVVDWGLARVSGSIEEVESTYSEERPLKSTLSGFSSNTMEGQAVGTPAYMSPEQANGRLDLLGPPSDVYCLGATLYSILTGVPPQSGNPDTVLQRVANGEFSIPSEINDWVPKPLEAACLKAMSLNPSDRYATPDELVHDVEAWVADEPVSAWQEPTSYRIRRWVRRNQTAVFGLTIGILTIAGAALIASIMLSAKNVELQQASQTIQQKNDELVTANQNESSARERADRVKEYLVSTFERTDPNQDGRALTLAELLDSSISKIDQDLAGDPLTQAEMYASIGHSYLGLGLYQEAKNAYERELKIRSGSQPKEHSDVLRSRYRVVNSMWRLSDYAEAEKRIADVLENQERLFGKENADTMNSMNMLALCLQAQGNYDAATPIFEELVELRTKVHGESSDETLLAINNLASNYNRESRFQEANELYELALAEQLSKYGHANRRTALAKQSLADNLRSIGEFDRAIDLFEEVVQFRKQKFGENHPDTLSSINSLVLAMQDKGLYLETVPLIKDVLEKHQQRHGDDHNRTLRALNTLGMALVRGGKISDAIPVFEKALPAYEAKFGLNNASTMSLVNNLAYTYLSNGDYAKSIPLFERAYKIRLKDLGAEHNRTILSYNNWALAIQRDGDTARALPMMRESYQQWKAKEGEDYFHTLSSARMLGTALRDAGLLDESKQLLKTTREKQIATLTADHPNVFSTEESLAATLIELEDYEAAKEQIESAVVALEKKFGLQNPQTLRAKRRQGELLQNMGQWEPSLNLLSEILPVMRTEIGSRHPTTLLTLSSLAVTYAEMGERDESRRYFQSAIGQLSDKIGEKHPYCLKARLDFARFLMETDETECESQLRSLWDQLPSDAERELLPSELDRRNETAKLFAKLYEKKGDESAQKKWQSRVRDR